MASVMVKDRQIQASRLEPFRPAEVCPRSALLASHGLTRTFGTRWQPPILNTDCAC